MGLSSKPKRVTPIAKTDNTYDSDLDFEFQGFRTENGSSHGLDWRVCCKLARQQDGSGTGVGVIFGGGGDFSRPALRHGCLNFPLQVA